MYSSVQRQRSDQCPVYAIWYLTPTGLIPVNGPVSLTRTRFVKPNQPTVIAKGAHPHLSLRGAQRRGNLVEVEHTSANHHCCGDEIATLRSQ
jgi:hypothetical protein